MFIDHSKIYVKAGDGGNGCLSFHTEKYITNGGPDGGDGGDGGNVVLQAAPNLTSLQNFRFKHKFIAQNGAKGMSKKHIVKHTTQLSGSDVGTILRNTHIRGFLTFGRCPASDGNLLGETILKHDALEVVDSVLGIETDVHLAAPVKNGSSIGEIDVGGFHHTLLLVVVERRNGDIATDVNPF